MPRADGGSAFAEGLQEPCGDALGALGGFEDFPDHGGKPAGPNTPNGPGTPYVPGTGPVPPAHQPSGWLASTGAKALTLLGTSGALLVTGGLVLGVSRHRRRTN
ncbi:hypothetical protein ACH4GP_19405 [Streptomyces celluloflavus]|uniref:Gram-positive cocci surface proteins LPxTG domain-containing protein n=1 Tax=Streptomyces celluloflavus TaxID=58344 RepID=A0ABW7RJM2_9ACTN